MIDRLGIVVIGAATWQIDPYRAVELVVVVLGGVIAWRRLRPDLEHQVVTKANAAVDAIGGSLDAMQRELEVLKARYHDANENRVGLQDALIKAQDALIDQMEEAKTARHALRNDLAAVQAQLANERIEHHACREELGRLRAEVGGRRQSDPT